MTDCIFCKIEQGDFNTNFVYEDNQLVVFSDINPKADHHYLIVPRQHIATLNDTVDKNLLGNMVSTAAQLAKKLGVDESGYRVIMNCNKDGGQEVFHIHLHLLAGQKLPGF